MNLYFKRFKIIGIMTSIWNQKIGADFKIWINLLNFRYGDVAVRRT